MTYQGVKPQVLTIHLINNPVFFCLAAKKFLASRDRRRQNGIEDNNIDFEMTKRNLQM